MRIASISVDLDSLPHYCRIHGLDEASLPQAARTAVYDVALPRFARLFSEAKVPATLFAIGEDLAEPTAAAALKAARQAGHEVASHSHAHDYALSRWSEEDVVQDLRRADEAIVAAVGQRPVGFRAPGYTLSPALYRAVARMGYRYGSSVFPAAPYYAAKAAVLGALQLLGRPSRSILDTPRVLLAPRQAYYPDPAAPYRAGAGQVLELPITTSRTLRVPFIGTLAVSFPWKTVEALYERLRGEPFVNFELHGIDVLDPAHVPAFLAARQRDVRVGWAKKEERLATLFAWLRRDFEVVTLQRAAERLAPLGKRGF